MEVITSPIPSGLFFAALASAIWKPKVRQTDRQLEPRGSQQRFPRMGAYIRHLGDSGMQPRRGPGGWGLHSHAMAAQSGQLAVVLYGPHTRSLSHVYEGAGRPMGGPGLQVGRIAIPGHMRWVGARVSTMSSHKTRPRRQRPTWPPRSMLADRAATLVRCPSWHLRECPGTYLWQRA
jgi:hypothetical protein